MSGSRRTNVDGFSAAQLRLLAREVDPARVRHRKAPDGAEIAYIEGWFAVAEANAVFGHSGWERETVHFERVFEQRRNDEVSCGYVARVKITVLAGQRRLIREGTGFGQARAAVIGDAHERAAKAAETDATKRALSTFGYRFGLGLYNKETQGSSGGNGKASDAVQRQTFVLLAPDGATIGAELSAEAFCGGFRQLVNQCQSLEMLEGLTTRNASQITQVAALGLKTIKGTLYSDILQRLVHEKAESVLASAPSANLAERKSDRSGDREEGWVGAPPDPADPLDHAKPEQSTAPTLHVDKSTLPIGVEKRVRDKDHLRAVAQMPCVVCNRQPAHAHHLKFAQRHGLSQKVSDEYVVPLCALHHGDLHRATREEMWWQQHGIDPLPIAQDLWARRLALQE